MACPASFGDKRLAGTGTTLDCSACTCSASAVCGPAKVDLFADGSCGTNIFSFGSGVCQPGGGATGSTVRSLRYTSAATPSYVATGPKTATVGLTTPKTICCH